MPKVTSIFDGGMIPEPGEANASLVSYLEDLLEAARSGEIVGVCCANLHSDRTGGFSNVGIVGGYSMLGAINMAKRSLEDFIAELDE